MGTAEFLPETIPDTFTVTSGFKAAGIFTANATPAVADSAPHVLVGKRGKGKGKGKGKRFSGSAGSTAA